MAYSNVTPNYDLPQYVADDYPSWLTDFNDAMSKIDRGMKTNKDNVAGQETRLQTVETNINTLNENFSEVDENVIRIDGIADQAEKNSATALLKAESIESSVQQHTTEIGVLENKTNTNTDDIDDLQSDNESNKARIYALEQKETPVYQPPIEFRFKPNSLEKKNPDIQGLLAGQYQLKNGIININCGAKGITGTFSGKLSVKLGLYDEDTKILTLESNSLINEFSTPITDIIKIDNKLSISDYRFIVNNGNMINFNANYSNDKDTGYADGEANFIGAFKVSQSSITTFDIGFSGTISGMTKNASAASEVYNTDSTAFNELPSDVQHIFNEIADYVYSIGFKLNQKYYTIVETE